MSEVEYVLRLSAKQEALLAPLYELTNISWSLRRVQGTGLKYWTILINSGAEWQGSEEWSVDGRTLKEVVELALFSIREAQNA